MTLKGDCMKKYRIEKDPILKCYIVWEIHRNYIVEVFRGYKYQCKEFIKNEKKINTTR